MANPPPNGGSRDPKLPTPPGGNTIFRHVQLEDRPQEAGPRTKAVLIADADFREGAFIRNSLESCGYDVSLWLDAVDALDRFRLRPFDLVVLSTNLGPKQLELLLEELRPKRNPPKVILIADEDEGDAAGRCFLKFLAVVNRPFQLSEVADIVEHLIGAP